MKLVFILLMLGLVGCEEERQPLERQRTNNSAYQVSFLFENDGCKIYRFVDAGNYRYYVNCGVNGSTEHTERCGKSCTRPVEVPSTWDNQGR